MVSSKETTPAAYLASLPPERRKVVAAVRAMIRKHLPDGYVETMNWGILSYEIPLSRYPVTYNKQPLAYMGLGAQKNNYVIHMMNVYAQPRLADQLAEGYKSAGKRLDMGKGCLRFKTIEDLPMDVLAGIVASTSVEEMIRVYESVKRKSSGAGP